MEAGPPPAIRLYLVYNRLIPAQVQKHSDSQRNEEGYCIIDKHVDSIICRLEQQDDEQVVEHDGNKYPCYSNTRLVLQGEAFPVLEPPPPNRDCDRCEGANKDPTHHSRNRSKEQHQRCDIPHQPEDYSQTYRIFSPLLHSLVLPFHILVLCPDEKAPWRVGKNGKNG